MFILYIVYYVLSLLFINLSLSLFPIFKKNYQNYDKLVKRHRTELAAALECILKLRLKPSYMWDLTDENCHQIYTRLSRLAKLLNLDLYSSHFSISISSTTFVDCSSFPSSATVATSSQLIAISVIELHSHNNNNDESSFSEFNNNSNLIFFGSIPDIISHINSILVELNSIDSNNDSNNNNNSNNTSTSIADNSIDESKSLTKKKNKKKKNNNNGNKSNKVETEVELIAEDKEKEAFYFNDSFFIDVSATLEEPCIMQYNKEAVIGRKYILLHLRDYLAANVVTATTSSSCLNANDCLLLDADDVMMNHHSDSEQQEFDKKEKSFYPKQGRFEYSDFFDLCFLSGVFLGYPVLYCNDTPTVGNCLSHHPLAVYTVKLDHHHVMYSFSVPLKFASHYQQRIDRWFERCCQRINQPERLKMEISIETHPLILT